MQRPGYLDLFRGWLLRKKWGGVPNIRRWEQPTLRG